MAGIARFLAAMILERSLPPGFCGSDRNRRRNRQAGYLVFGQSEFGASLDIPIGLSGCARTILPSQPVQSMIRSRHRRIAWHSLLSGLGSAAPARTL